MKVENTWVYVMEQARRHAEKEMNGIWDREDHIYVGVFYNRMLNYIKDNYSLNRITLLQTITPDTEWDCGG